MTFSLKDLVAQQIRKKKIPKKSKLNIVKIAKLLKNVLLLFESLLSRIAMNNFLSRII